MKYKDKTENENPALEAIKKTAGEINSKFDGLETRIKEIEDLSEETGKMPEALKAELTALTDKHALAQKELKAQFEAMQEQLDKVDVGSQFKDKHPIAFDQHIKELVTENFEDLKEVGNRNKNAKLIKIKADMTLGSDFTGEVIDRDRLPGVFYDPTRSTSQSLRWHASTCR